MLDKFIEALKAQNKAYAVAISNYLLSQIEIDEYLRNKLDTTDKTLEQCVEYLRGEAQKKAVDKVAIMTDDEVYQLVKHFFLEDSITAETKTSKVEKSKDTDDDEMDDEEIEQAKPKEEVQKKVKRVKEKLYEQISLFD